MIVVEVRQIFFARILTRTISCSSIIFVFKVKIKRSSSKLHRRERERESKTFY